MAHLNATNKSIFFPAIAQPHDEVSEKHYLAYGSRLAGGEEVGVSAFVAHGVAAVVLGRNMMSR